MNSSEELQSPPPRRRTPYLTTGRSRWGPMIDPAYNASLSAIPKVIPSGLSLEQLEALLVRVRIEEITKQISMGDVGLSLIDERDRSPSPEPIYDKDGKRLNTREQRAKEKLNKERTELVELALAMDSTFKPPPDYAAATAKKSRKILIPQDKYPEYNFIGLIIGPRGNTQKRLEKETGCKIAIRGKGSVKEGKLSKNISGEDEPLHVLLTADNIQNLDKGTKAISELLIPKDELTNEHKKAQLRELAIINGTLRDNFWNLRTERSFEPANVKCAICGEQSHPTVDCPLKDKTSVILPGDTQTMNSEYEQFLKEIGDPEFETVVAKNSQSPPPPSSNDIQSQLSPPPQSIPPPQINIQLNQPPVALATVPTNLIPQPQRGMPGIPLAVQQLYATNTAYTIPNVQQQVPWMNPVNMTQTMPNFQQVPWGTYPGYAYPPQPPPQQ